MVATSCHLHTAQARPPGVPQAALQKPRESLAPPTYVKKRAWPEDAGTASLPPSPDEVRLVNGGDHGGTLSWSHNMHRAFTDNEWTAEPIRIALPEHHSPFLPLHDEGPSPVHRRSRSPQVRSGLVPREFRMRSDTIRKGNKETDHLQLLFLLAPPPSYSA